MSLFTVPQRAQSTVQFENRQVAGEQLAEAILQAIAQTPPDPALGFVVYALPKGGLPVAQPIAQALHCPLDVVVAKKITLPNNPELAIGAVTATGEVVWASGRRRLSEETRQTALYQAESEAQIQFFDLAASSRRYAPGGTIALVVDDGIATGMTMAVAVQALRNQQSAQIWICVPVAPPDLMAFLHAISDRVIVLATPTPFHSVSRFYQEFFQVSIEEARELLQSGRSPS